MITLNVNSLVNAEIFWKELGLEEEVALNEAVITRPQTITMTIPYIDEVRDKVIELGLATSEIVPTANDKFMFSFVAPEENTVIIIGDWVCQPYTSEKRAEFFHNIKHVDYVRKYEQLTTLTEGEYLLFGRLTCPWTRYFARQLPEIWDKKIYFIDTEYTDFDTELASLREKYEAPFVPTFVKIEKNGSFVKYNEKIGTLTEFVK